MLNFCIANVIYGKEYVETFLYTLSSQISNLEYLNKFNHSIFYRIYTTKEDKSIIINSPLFNYLSTFVNIEFIDIEKFFQKISHFTMTSCHNDTIQYANKMNAIIIFLAPDIILSNNVFEKICRSLSNGKRILMGAALRLNKEQFTKFNNSNDLLNIKPRALIKKALPHLHQLTYDTFWDYNDKMYCWPAILGWKLDEHNILIRGFHLHPIFIWPKNKKILSQGSIDHDFVNNSIPNKKALEILENSDEAVLFELTTKNRINPGSYHKKKLRIVFDFAHKYLLPYHVKFAQKNIYILTTDYKNSIKWKQKERQADKIINFITRYYTSFLYRKIKLPSYKIYIVMKHIYFQKYIPIKTKFINKLKKLREIIKNLLTLILPPIIVNIFRFTTINYLKIINTKKSTNTNFKNIRFFNSKGFSLKPLNALITDSNATFFNIFFLQLQKNNEIFNINKIINKINFILLKLTEIKKYKNIVFINNFSIKEKFQSDNLTSHIHFCTNINELLQIKLDIFLKKIIIDCIVFLYITPEIEPEIESAFITQITQSPEFYNTDLILPSDNSGWIKLERKFGFPIVSYHMPWAGTNRFLPQLNVVFEKLKWIGIPTVGYQRNLRFTKKYYSVKNSKPNLKDLSFYLNGTIASMDYFHFSYLHAWTTLKETLNHKETNYIVLMRDPRDIITSYSTTVFNSRSSHFKDLSKEELLMTIINGVIEIFPCEYPACFLEWPSLNEILDLYLFALNQKNINVIRFEDLHNNNTKAMKKLLKNLGLYPSIFYDFDDNFFKYIEHIATFEYQTQGKLKRGNSKNWVGVCRKGIPGDWKNHFTPKIIQYIKDTTKDKLIRLGYEKNMDWSL